MKKKELMKKGLVLLLCGAFVSGMTGCGSSESFDADTTALEAGEESISYPLYQWYLIQAYDDAYEECPDSSDIFSETIDGEKAEDWIEDRAVALATRHIAVLDQCAEEGITLDEDTQDEIDESVENFWNAGGYGQYYEPYGVDEDAYRASLEEQKLEEVLWTELKEDVSDDITEDEMKAYYEAHCVGCEYVAVPFTSVQDDEYENSDDYEYSTEAIYDTEKVYNEFSKEVTDVDSLEKLMEKVADTEEYLEAGCNVSGTDNGKTTMFYDSYTGISNEVYQEIVDAPEGEITNITDKANQYWIILNKVNLEEDADEFAAHTDTLKDLVATEKYDEYLLMLTPSADVKENKKVTRKQNLEELFG